MRRGVLVAGFVALAGAGGVACGGDGGGGSENGAGASGGVGGSSGGSGGSGGTSSGGTSSGGSGGSGGSTQPECADGEVSCNGECVGNGESAGGCTVLTATAGGISIDHGMALDDTHVYWVEQGGHIGVSRVAKAGGGREVIVESEDVPFSPAVNSSQVFFSEDGFSDATLRSAPKTGGASTPLLTHTDVVDAVAVNESRVFFSREFPFDFRHEIVSVPVGGGDEIIHAETGTWSDHHTAVDSSHVYWVSGNFFDPAQIQRTTHEGTTVEAVTSAGDIGDFVLAGDFVYFVDVDGNLLQRVAKTGGTPELVYDVGDSDISLGEIAVKDGFVYWTTTNAVDRVGIDGQNPTQVLQTAGTVTLIEADASGVYIAVNRTRLGGPGFVVKLDE